MSQVADIQQFAALIGELPPNEALALGALRTGLLDEVKVVTKAKLPNGVAQPNFIARTGANIIYREGQPALALLDFDTKGMAPDVAAELKRLGGFWEALLSVLPALRDVARVVRLLDECRAVPLRHRRTAAGVRWAAMCICWCRTAPTSSAF